MIDTIIGLGMMYSWVHFLVIAFTTAPKDRTKYEKTISIIAVVFFGLYLFGSMMLFL